MREALPVPQPPALFERLLDVGVGVEDPLTGEQADGLVEMAARTNRRVNLEPVLQTGVEVVGAVTRCGVDRASARVERHVLGEHADRVAIVEWMSKADAFEDLALHLRDRSIEG